MDDEVVPAELRRLRNLGRIRDAAGEELVLAVAHAVEAGFDVREIAEASGLTGRCVRRIIGARSTEPEPRRPARTRPAGVRAT